MNYAFASDNSAPLCPEAMRAMDLANQGMASSYGSDPVTERATDAVRKLFETDCAVYFVTTGTAANALALSAVCGSHHAIVCHEAAHLQTDECGAPEFFTGGAKLLLLKGAHGKLEPGAVEATGRGAPRRRPLLEGRGLEPDPIDRSRHGLHLRRGRGFRRGRPPSRPPAPHGRGPFANAVASLGVRRAPSPGRPGSTCCPSAGPRTAWAWPRPSFLRPAPWPRTSSTDASRRAS